MRVVCQGSSSTLFRSSRLGPGSSLHGFRVSLANLQRTRSGPRPSPGRAGPFGLELRNCQPRARTFADPRQHSPQTAHPGEGRDPVFTALGSAWRTCSEPVLVPGLRRGERGRLGWSPATAGHGRGRSPIRANAPPPTAHPGAGRDPVSTALGSAWRTCSEPVLVPGLRRGERGRLGWSSATASHGRGRSPIRASTPPKPLIPAKAGIQSSRP